jgi:hypothetical protein
MMVEPHSQRTDLDAVGANVKGRKRVAPVERVPERPDPRPNPEAAVMRGPVTFTPSERLAEQVELGHVCREWLAANPDAKRKRRRVAKLHADALSAIEWLVAQAGGPVERPDAVAAGRRCACGAPAEPGRNVCGPCRGRAQRARAAERVDAVPAQAA